MWGTCQSTMSSLFKQHMQHHPIYKHWLRGWHWKRHVVFFCWCRACAQRWWFGFNRHLSSPLFFFSLLSLSEYKCVIFFLIWSSFFWLLFVYFYLFWLIFFSISPIIIWFHLFFISNLIFILLIVVCLF